MINIKKVIEVCTRVEGHGNINIYMDNQHEEISHVNFEIAPFRGFENILLRKSLLDIPRLTARICGLCHSSQAIASCKAVENIYEVEPSERSILLRRLLMTGELIKSHSIHFFYQSLPDLLEIFNITKATPSFYQLKQYDPQLTACVDDLIKLGSDIDNIFGGRVVHLITLYPGGVIYEPSRKNISLAKKMFQKSLSNIEGVIERFVDIFSKFEPSPHFQLLNQSFLSLNNNGSYDRYAGILNMKDDKNRTVEFSEKYYSDYFNKDNNLRGIDFKDKIKVLVGPLARYKIVENYLFDEVQTYLSYFKGDWNNNLLYGNFLRLLEIYTEIIKGMEILEDPALNQKEKLPSLKSIKNSEGFGVVEAPRGTLIHHYMLDKTNSIQQVKLFIATELNIPLINQMITEQAKKLYETRDINFVKKNIQMIVRAFDPCISCASH